MVVNPLRRAVFLDRDGVINKAEVRDGKPYAPRKLKDFRLLPKVSEAVQTLRTHGFSIIIVTNQPDIGNGLVTQDVVDSMHDKLRKRIAIDDIFVCPHRQTDRCDCRKPMPGMLLAAASRHGINLEKSILVGDRISDILSGISVGCYTVFIRR
jgi:D-glycero-D-manno-heptose 1,7-bisphosphate phosphatase